MNFNTATMATKIDENVTLEARHRTNDSPEKNLTFNALGNDIVLKVRINLIRHV
ncbi:MAG: hypothetical protein HQK51_15270 [Oligoflexia bacterium]|nr:hypothetical protein [Oligoflexia bacterium]